MNSQDDAKDLARQDKPKNLHGQTFQKFHVRATHCFGVTVGLFLFVRNIRAGSCSCITCPLFREVTPLPHHFIAVNSCLFQDLAMPSSWKESTLVSPVVIEFEWQLSTAVLDLELAPSDFTSSFAASASVFASAL